jgi:tRNA(Ile)-lysidine synthase TilS/MesJ
MARRKIQRQPPGTRQKEKLHNFIEYEKEAVKDLEYLCEINGTKLNYQELSVALFIQKSEYRKKPGSLVCLYRVWKSETTENVTQRERYALYYQALQEWG